MNKSGSDYVENYLCRWKLALSGEVIVFTGFVLFLMDQYFYLESEFTIYAFILKVVYSIPPYLSPPLSLPSLQTEYDKIINRWTNKYFIIENYIGSDTYIHKYINK